MAVPANIQKVVFPANRLPYSSSDGHYYIRYRIITESQDVFSSWSPKFKVPVVSISDIVTQAYNSNETITSDGQNLTLHWDLPTNINLDTFDIYAKWSDQTDEPTLGDWSFIDWEYVNTVRGNSATIPIFPESRYVRLWVQVPTNQKNTSSAAKLFESDTAFINQVQSVDGGTPDQVFVDGNLL